MFKKILSLTLIALLVNVWLVSPVRAGAQVVEQTPNAEKVRESIRKLGTGDAARVELKLWDGKKLKGYIRDAGQESFVLTDAKTGAFHTVAYAQVKQVKGHNNLTAAKVGLTLAKGAAIVGAVALAFTLLILVTVPKT
ncbi:MAG TPA: hypothetical protein VGW12_08700 [Pyrinomonadaceae bacterium]|nr:hypothetical protein [Pyrinomonadaceae bacterium]